MLLKKYMRLEKIFQNLLFSLLGSTPSSLKFFRTCSFRPFFTSSRIRKIMTGLIGFSLRIVSLRLLNAVSLQLKLLKFMILFDFKYFYIFQFLFFSSTCNLYSSMRSSIPFKSKTIFSLISCRN